ncbi:MAG: hypothetical protein IKV33_06550 [Alistipes sp.]|nr:hypothetical protein [Alistipes sp.]
MPVMTTNELRNIQEGNIDFDAATIDRWEQRLTEKNNQMQKHFADAHKRQPELCKAKEANK